MAKRPRIAQKIDPDIDAAGGLERTRRAERVPPGDLRQLDSADVDRDAAASFRDAFIPAVNLNATGLHGKSRGQECQLVILPDPARYERAGHDCAETLP